MSNRVKVGTKEAALLKTIYYRRKGFIVSSLMSDNERSAAQRLRKKGLIVQFEPDIKGE